MKLKVTRRISSSPSLIVVLVSAFFVWATSLGQEIIGTDICICSPSTYEFTLDFTLTCPPPTNNVATGIDNGSIEETSCFITQEIAGTITDFTPVEVDTIEILELDKDFVQIGSSTEYGGGSTTSSTPFVNGDTISYTTKSATTSSIDKEILPKAIQLLLRGRNVLNQPIQNSYLITFSNDCNANSYPTLEIGESIGWTVFVSIHFCLS